MNTELFEALKLLEKEKGIPVEYMLSQIEKSILVACKSAYGGNNDARVDMDPEKGIFDVYLNKEVVEEVFDPDYEISLQDARAIDAKVQLEDKIGVKLDPKQFGRIAVQVARNTIRQGIRDGEKSQVLVEFQSKVQEIVSAHVERIDPKSGNATIRIGKAEAVLPKSEQVAGEVIHEGDTIKVYVADVKSTEKGPRVIISRTHPGFVRRLFELEIPEIYEGLIEIKNIVREPGSRTKIAVYSKDMNIDPVGSCVGPRGIRIQNILNELKDEKIDVVEWSEDPVQYIASALSPATVLAVDIDEENMSSKVVVPDNQLSLAIAKDGQNARLSAKLTGWKIDIKSETQIKGEV